jgi:hypothetical protein
MEIHTLDFNLPAVNGVIVPPNLNELNCKVPNCIQCNNAGTICIECQGHFELNQQGQCDEVDENNQLMSVIEYPIPDFVLSTNCIDFNCESCGDEDGQEMCDYCKKGFALDEKTGNCETSPIEGCNYFEVKKGRTICYDCHEGYELENNECVPDNQSTANSVETSPFIQVP